eukprot:COSAG06_NODE_4122_length_4548_cov_102.653405_6_plen_99_part_00
MLIFLLEAAAATRAPKPVCPAALAEAVVVLLRAFPCVCTPATSTARLCPFAARGARGVLHFHGELPHAAACSYAHLLQPPNAKAASCRLARHGSEGRG